MNLLTAYGLWWGVTRAIKWLFILGWPVGIVIVIAQLFGIDHQKWSEATQRTITIISFCISVPVYMIFRRGNEQRD